MGSRAIFRRAQEQPFFVQAISGLPGGALVPVPGGVLVRDAEGSIVGAVGVTGDTSDNDETCAIAGIEAAGYAADPGRKTEGAFERPTSVTRCGDVRVFPLPRLTPAHRSRGHGP